MDAQCESSLVQAYGFLKTGDTVRAKALVEDALARDLNQAEVIFALGCVNFWADKLPRPLGETPEERGDFLINSWERFTAFAGGGADYERCFGAVRAGVFTRALDAFLEALNTHRGGNEGELYRKAGICHKKLGEYETALSFLSEASALLNGAPPVLAEMADCYALCGNERAAKVLFRDAFFADPSGIDLSFLDCQMIVDLIRRVEKKGFSGDALAGWIPVYGVLYGVFNIKRGLRPHEAGKLSQEITALENELKEAEPPRELAVPKLINHYFWLIDHLAASHAERSRIEQTLLKIKLLDPEVHKQYTGGQPGA
ncbi:MAG: hypothetical protein LBR23_02245 [Spirochaetaceae bacterium]|jgi:tetratricopeptide (TPR) repeat protein|nr:hypothetical protein [Spirochaetaceae bacterium]